FSVGLILAHLEEFDPLQAQLVRQDEGNTSVPGKSQARGILPGGKMRADVLTVEWMTHITNTGFRLIRRLRPQIVIARKPKGSMTLHKPGCHEHMRGARYPERCGYKTVERRHEGLQH